MDEGTPSSIVPLRQRCPRCGETKPTSEFYWLKFGRHDRYCKECRKALNREWRQRNPDAHKRPAKRAWERNNAAKIAFYSRKARYGISHEQYQALVEQQGGRCAICRRLPDRKRPLHIDHDHDTGAIRGLLCYQCNTAIGLFGDNPAVVASAMLYLLAVPPPAAGKHPGDWWPRWSLGPDGRPDPPQASGDG